MRRKGPFLLQELSGSLGDLATFLPYVLASISAAGLSSASVFIGFGLFYLWSGWFYALPMAVQPMKAVAAVILVQKITGPEVAAAGIVMGLILLILGLTGMITKIARFTPNSVVGGLQLGLGISLAVLGLKMVLSQPVLGIACLLLMLLLLFVYQAPAALIVLLLGTVCYWLISGEGLSQPINIGLHLPSLVIPSSKDFGNGFLMLVLSQLPLTITNAVLVTSLLSRELFPQQAGRVTERNLCLTMGGANLLLAPWGGFMMCHGSGGLAAHYRYGGRTALTVYIIGAIFVAIGLLLGDDAIILLRLIPEAVLGALLFYSGIDLAMASKISGERPEVFVILLVAVLTIAVNPAVAFLAGIIVEEACRRNLIKLHIED